jgi:hypothetical protein
MPRRKRWTAGLILLALALMAPGVSAQTVDEPLPTQTPVTVPTAIPTCAANIFYAGTGFSCVTPVPPTPVPTATPQPNAVTGSVPGVLYLGNFATIAQSTTYYLSPIASGQSVPQTSENNVVLAGKAMSITSMSVRLNTNVGGSGQTVVATFRKNNGAGNNTCTINTGSSFCSVTNQTDTLTATDFWDVQLVTGATTGSFTYVAISLGYTD